MWCSNFPLGAGFSQVTWEPFFDNEKRLSRSLVKTVRRGPVHTSRIFKPSGKLASWCILFLLCIIVLSYNTLKLLFSELYIYIYNGDMCMIFYYTHLLFACFVFSCFFSCFVLCSNICWQLYVFLFFMFFSVWSDIINVWKE